MKETRKLDSGRVRAECIRYNWYTDIFAFIRTLNTATTDDLETVAKDIKEHSDTECEIEDIMFVLANDCCITFFDY